MDIDRDDFDNILTALRLFHEMVGEDEVEEALELLERAYKTALKYDSSES